MKAHQPKVAEYFEFCDEIYSKEHYKYHLTFEKVYRFMYYQAFRPLKPRGGKRKYHYGGTPVRRLKRSRRSVIVHEEEPFDNQVDDDNNCYVPESSLHFDTAMYHEVMAQFSGAPASPGSSTSLFQSKQ